MPLCPSEFPALKLLDFPPLPRLPTLKQVTSHLDRPWSSGFLAESGWPVPALLRAKENAQRARVCLVPPPPSHIFGWVTKLAGNPTPA